MLNVHHSISMKLARGGRLTLLVLSLFPAALVAQRDSGRSYRVAIRAGAIALGRGEDLEFTHTLGVTAALAVGRSLANRVSAEAELSGAWFGTEDVVTAPASSDTTPGFGFMPFGPVAALSLAANAVYTDDPKASGSIVVAGFGVSRFHALPQHAGTVRPFAQLGVGARIPTEPGYQLVLEARWQVFARGYGPRWFVPMTIGLRFRRESCDSARQLTSGGVAARSAVVGDRRSPASSRRSSSRGACSRRA